MKQKRLEQMVAEFVDNTISFKRQRRKTLAYKKAMRRNEELQAEGINAVGLQRWNEDVAAEHRRREELAAG